MVVIPSAARNLHFALLALANVAGAQSLATRVERAPDGIVLMEVRSRPGVCGNGRDLVGYRNALFARNFQTYGRWSTDHCRPGPLRIVVSKVDGAITRVHTQVGGAWPSTELRVTDLGAVPPAEASPFFLSLVPRLERSRDDRLLVPAVLADVEPPLVALLALARDGDRRADTRRSAVHWLGSLGDETVVTPLTQLARDGYDEDGVGGSAMAALSMLEGAAGETAGRWLIARAQDPKEPSKLRKDALFWAGQDEETPTVQIVRAYENDGDNAFREHAIFVLSQRDDNAALEALMRIAREDRDTRMRGKALFWLGQKDDPRARKLIADIVLKP
jgi:hypothetical protein